MDAMTNHDPVFAELTGAPETKSAVSRPAVRTTPTDPMKALAEQIEAGNRTLESIAATQKSRNLDEAKSRALAAVREAGTQQEPLRRQARPDPLLDEKARRASAAIDAANDEHKAEIERLRRENAILTAKTRRPPAPSFREGGTAEGAAGSYSAKSRDFAIYRKAMINYIKTGQETFNGQSIQALERKALAGQSNPDGGFLLHPEYDQGPLEKLLLQYVQMRQIATVRPISAASFKKSVSLRGVTASWVGETESRSATGTPTLAEIEVPAMELYASPLASQSLLEDGYIDVESWLAEEVADAFGLAEATAFFSGDGTKRPMGLLSYPKVSWTSSFNASQNFGKTPYIATGADGDFIAASGANGPGDVIINLPYTVKTGYRDNGKYMMNRTLLSKVRQIKDAYGRYLWSEGNLAAGQQSTLNGYGVVEAEQMPAMASGTYPMAFGDYARTYLIVDRVGMSVLRDPYSAKPSVMFYTRKRVGGGIQNFEAMTLLKAATS